MANNVNDIIQNARPDDFEFAKREGKISDLKFDTKPIGYLKDAWIRFRRSKAAVFGAIVIILIVLFAIIMPLTPNYSPTDVDGGYAYMRPYNSGLAKMGICDGTYSKVVGQKAYTYLTYIGVGVEDHDGKSASLENGVNSEFYPITKIKKTYEEDGLTYRSCKVMSYYEKGFIYQQMTVSEYNAIKEWETQTGKQIFYPMVDTTLVSTSTLYTKDANYWYSVDSTGYPLDQDGKRVKTPTQSTKLADAYLRDSEGNPLYYRNVASEGQYMTRIFYWNYYQYKHGHLPSYIFGTDTQGRDIASRLAAGIGLSLILSISTFAINFVIGATYGAIEGYYGGWADLIMERISDILNDVPFMVLASIVNIQLISTGKMSALGALIFAFVLTGWLGPAYRVRTQFYRFKNEEYVLAARTLGASDARIMFKHIFPNTLGTIITASVLTIPGTIFSESSLSYLHIINLEEGGITSLGTMLSDAQPYLTTYPYMIVPPAIIISLLMISFNLFGNGLRDAFNPSLRGTED